MTDPYADPVDSRQRIITACQLILQSEAARDLRDDALAERYAELQADGLGMIAAVRRIQEELAAVFTSEQLRHLGVSNSQIRAAVGRRRR